MQDNLPDFWRGNNFDRQFGDVRSLQKQIDQMFNDFMLPMAMPMSNMSMQKSLMGDIEETDSHYLLSFDIPGVKKEDLKIRMHGNQLQISGERRDEHTENKKGQSMSQRSYGSFSQSITLPSGVKAEDIETECKDGVLRIAIPKSEESKPREIAVGEGKTGFFQKLLGKKSEQSTKANVEKLN